MGKEKQSWTDSQKKGKKKGPRPGFEPGTCYNHGFVMGLTRNNNHTSRPPRLLLIGRPQLLLMYPSLRWGTFSTNPVTPGFYNSSMEVKETLCRDWAFVSQEFLS